MKFMALLLLASPSEPKLPEPLMPSPAGFDLGKVKSVRPCGWSAQVAIVVSGHLKFDEIVVRDAGRFASRPVRAEVKLPGGATADMHAEQHVMPDGKSAPALMVSVKVPF